jgi:hypothetical protein
VTTRGLGIIQWLEKQATGGFNGSVEGRHVEKVVVDRQYALMQRNVDSDDCLSVLNPATGPRSPAIRHLSVGRSPRSIVGLNRLDHSAVRGVPMGIDAYI